VALEVTGHRVRNGPPRLSPGSEPFFTTKEQERARAQPGHGLRIVNQSGGTIRVHSEPGAGTTFLVYFPARTPGPRTNRRGRRSGAVGGRNHPRGRGRGHGRELVCETLRGCGYTVLEAADGEEAISASGEYGAPSICWSPTWSCPG
jgi:hypothetical protein